MTIQSLIDNIIEKNAIGVQETFNSLLAERIATKLEIHKRVVAQSMFTEGSGDMDPQLAYHKDKINYHTDKRDHYVNLADKTGKETHFITSVHHDEMVKRHQAAYDNLKADKKDISEDSSDATDINEEDDSLENVKFPLSDVQHERLIKYHTKQLKHATKKGYTHSIDYHKGAIEASKAAILKLKAGNKDN